MRGIFWEITARCNLRCKHCYLHNELEHPSIRPDNELNTEECLKIVEQFDECGIFHVTVLGGEPLARPDILVILHCMGEKKFWTRVDTNGTLIDEHVASELANIDIKGMNFSLDGHNPEINDAIRGKGAFKKAFRGIKNLRDFEIPFHVGMTINKINCNSIEEMADFCYRMGAEKISLKLYVDFPSNSFSSQLQLGKKEIFIAARKVNKLKEKYSRKFISSNLPKSLGFLSPESKNATNNMFVRCGMGATQLVILNNGDVIPCTYIRDRILGNLTKTHLSNIPDSPEFEIFKKLREITIDEANETCAACEWKYYCGGGCRGEAYLMSGDLFSPDPQRCLLCGGNIDD
ncbi:MAG: radical SAM protein [Candidatus Methanofastidiosia archaeon]|jgi:radical SAM protein with 4Fe4S-binding SPASM domain